VVTGVVLMREETLFHFIFLFWFISMVLFLYFTIVYSKYRKEALATMKKTRIIAYCIPLLISIPLAIIVYHKMADYSLNFTSVWVVIVGAILGLVLFDIFESRRVKQSKANLSTP